VQHANRDTCMQVSSLPAVLSTVTIANKLVSGNAS
jgi:hypothetical protein